MKKLIAVSVILILIAGILTACGSETAPSTSVQEEAAKVIDKQHAETVPSSGSEQQQQTDNISTADNQTELPPTVENDKAEETKLIKAKVTKAVDGDTVHVRLKSGKEEKVRFIGVDTPESTMQVEPYGKEAAAYTKSKLLNKDVWLELDVQERDKYGRLLAYVWLSPPTKESAEEIRTNMFNAVLLLEGYAQVMTVPPNVKYAEYFRKYQQEAMEKNAGLWGLEVKEEKPASSQAVSVSYIGNKNSKKFHLPDCQWAKKISPANRVYFKSRDEAVNAGYVPCKVCKS